MALGGSSAFSEDGRYFSSYGADGKLKIWETGTGVLKQEYTPNLHLSSPCTCLTWIRIPRTASKPSKKRKLKAEDDMDVIVMGTASGNILLYSLVTGSILTQLDDNHGSSVNYVSWNPGCSLFSCGNEYIVEWSIGDKNIRSKWKGGSDRVTCLLVVPDGKTLLSASRTISWWNLSDKQLIKRFVGHATDIMSLTFVSASSTSAESYVLSAASGDRYLSAWSLNPANESRPVASFTMDDEALSVSVCAGDETEPPVMTAVTGTGNLLVYRHQLNGRCEKPLKPKVTIQITSDTGQNKEAVKPIPVVAGHLCDRNVILIAYGNQVFLAFERIVPNFKEKVMCITRKDPRKLTVSKEEVVSKVRIPAAGDSVEYVTPAAVAATPTKRIRRLKSDVPMEDRIANLALDRPEPQTKGIHRRGNMSQLLIQGLQSRDKQILQCVLFQRDENVIKQTVGRLPVQVILPLVQELTTLITESKVAVSRVAVLWLKAVLTAHASQLLANAELASTVSPILGLVETRLGVLAPLSRLRGRLDLLVDQITESSNQPETDRLQESLLVYQDVDSSDEGSIADVPMNSDSDDHWDELSEEAVDEAAEDSEPQENDLIDLDSSD